MKHTTTKEESEMHYDRKRIMEIAEEVADTVRDSGFREGEYRAAQLILLWDIASALTVIAKGVTSGLAR